MTAELRVDGARLWARLVELGEVGAIKGPNRFDTFWGAGPEAVAIAGGMSATGEALILLPKGAAARALAQP